jgi:predicted O-methyltransferase YrrM
MPADYDFTVDWFSPHWPVWADLTKDRAILTALEIGSFEGRSTCRMIEVFGAKNPLHVVCVDTWGGGVEHSKLDMSAAERRFDANTQKAAAAATHKIDITKLKGSSAEQLLALLGAGWRGNFDLVFVDGSHQAPDVLTDLVLGYELARVGGLIICDDYLWSMEKHGAEDLLNMPRIAVDAFKTIFARKVRQFSLPAYQCYLEKTA